MKIIYPTVTLINEEEEGKVFGYVSKESKKEIHRYVVRYRSVVQYGGISNPGGMLG